MYLQRTESDILLQLAFYFGPKIRKSGTINTLRTGDADLRFYITTVQDG